MFCAARCILRFVESTDQRTDTLTDYIRFFLLFPLALLMQSNPKEGTFFVRRRGETYPDEYVIAVVYKGKPTVSSSLNRHTDEHQRLCCSNLMTTAVAISPSLCLPIVNTCAPVCVVV